MRWHHAALAGAGGGGPLVTGDPRAFAPDDVDDYIDLGTLPLAAAGKTLPISVFATVKRSLYSGSGNIIIGALAGSAPVRLVVDTRQIDFRVFTASGTFTLFRSAASSLTDNVRYRVGGTWDGSSVGKVYRNGLNATSSQPTLGGTINAAQSTMIARDSSSYGGFSGLLSLALVYGFVSDAQYAAADALLNVYAYDDFLTYIDGIGFDGLLVPITSTDNLTGGTGSVAVYSMDGTRLSATPVNTSPAALVAVPA